MLEQIKDINKTRVVVAMSGGVDSSVAAALYAEAGYDVIGITLQLYDSGKTTKNSGTCCAGQDIYDARRVASKIGIPHYVLNYQDKFKTEVMDSFADSYINGETPIPCITCNQTVKFRDLALAAHNLGADVLATGHYVRQLPGPSGPELHRAIDLEKDQSYFLFATTIEQLSFLRFPLGELSKSSVRQHAKRFDLSISDKPDSQDICFVPNGKYADIIEKLRPSSYKPGNIIDQSGKVLGSHKGIINYTIGQRRGLEIGSPVALYVTNIDKASNTVTVGPKESLLCNIVYLRDQVFLDSSIVPGSERKVIVRLRSSHPGAEGLLCIDQNSKAYIQLTTPETKTSPGQAAVCYDGDRILGGGWITETNSL